VCYITMGSTHVNSTRGHNNTYLIYSQDIVDLVSIIFPSMASVWLFCHHVPMSHICALIICIYAKFEQIVDYLVHRFIIGNCYFRKVYIGHSSNNLLPFFGLMVHIFCFTFIGLEIKEARVNAMRSAISETFPEPNRRLLQRLASHYSHRFQYWITYILLGEFYCSHLTFIGPPVYVNMMHHLFCLK
jgi:hypothetical protein